MGDAHSFNNMEATVFIHECQNITKTSKGMQESRHFQCNYKYLQLITATFLGLLFGGMIGLITVCLISNAGKSSCQELRNDTYGPKTTINISGEKTQYIFNITKKGTYMFYGKVERNERRDCTDNIDLVRLQWRRPNAPEITKSTRFYNNNEKYVAEIMAFDVLLEENSEVQLQLNCKGNNNTGTFTYRVY